MKRELPRNPPLTQPEGGNVKSPCGTGYRAFEVDVERLEGAPLATGQDLVDNVRLMTRREVAERLIHTEPTPSQEIGVSVTVLRGTAGEEIFAVWQGAASAERGASREGGIRATGLPNTRGLRWTKAREKMGSPGKRGGARCNSARGKNAPRGARRIGRGFPRRRLLGKAVYDVSTTQRGNANTRGAQSRKRGRLDDPRWLQRSSGASGQRVKEQMGDRRGRRPRPVHSEERQRGGGQLGGCLSGQRPRGGPSVPGLQRVQYRG